MARAKAGIQKPTSLMSPATGRSAHRLQRFWAQRQVLRRLQDRLWGVTTPETFTKFSRPIFCERCPDQVHLRHSGRRGRPEALRCRSEGHRQGWSSGALTPSSVWAIWALTPPPLPGPVRKSLHTTDGFTASSTRPLPHRDGQQAGVTGCPVKRHPDPDRFLLQEHRQDDRGRRRHHHLSLAHQHLRGFDAAAAPPPPPTGSAQDDMRWARRSQWAIPFYINDPATGKRRIRSGETKLGDFVADGISLQLETIGSHRISPLPGGGIRTDVRAGPLSFKTCKTVSPLATWPA